MPVVEGVLRDVAGDPVSGIVTLRLITSVDGSRPPAFLAGGVTILGSRQPDVDVDGSWSENLFANSNLSPAGTYYEFIGQAPREPARGLAFIVPAGAGPYDLTDLIVDPPGTIGSSALAAHVASAHAHTAAQIDFEPVATIAADDAQSAVEEVAAESGQGTYVHTQASAASVWNVTHGLGRVPAGLYVEESTGDDLEPGRADPDANNITLDFDGVAVSGTAYVS